MPQKFRQRGKKKSKTAEKEQQGQQHQSHRDGPHPSNSRTDGRGERAAAPQSTAYEVNSNLIPLGGNVGSSRKESIRHDIPDDTAIAGAAEASQQGSDVAPMHIPVDLGSHIEAEAHNLVVAPFGFVPPELKAYLKEAHTSLLQQDAEAKTSDQVVEDEEEDGDGGGQTSMLRQAMLREINGQELTVATDGECSVALEKIIDGLDGRRVRILADRASGSCAVLASHRFGSHVLQSILRGLQSDLVRSNSLSAKGKGRQAHQEEAGVLRSAEQLILDFTEEISPQSQTLIQDTFGTYVVRTMLQLLAGQVIEASSRSKKSAAFRNKTQVAAEGEEGPPASTISRPLTRAKLDSVRVPLTFPFALESLRRSCVPLDTTGRNEARALLVSPSASPTFALLLSLEASAGEAAIPGSLADIVLEGLITAAGETVAGGEDELTAATESSDGVETLLRHPSGSHSLQAIISHLPSRIVNRFWITYIRGKVSRLACHPVGNFVQASAVQRLGRPLVQEALEEIRDDEGGKMVKESKTGVLLALMDRAAALCNDGDASLEALALDAVLRTFGFGERAKKEEEEAGLAVKAILALKTRDGWQKMMRRRADKAAKQAAQSAAVATPAERAAELEDVHAPKKRKRGEEDNEEEEGHLRQEEATVQGSLLLQALARLREPYNDVVYKGLLSISSPLPYASNPIASHVYLTSLSSPTSSFAQRRRLLLSLLPHLPILADDKYASRLSDAVWDRADGFTREKILREILLQRASRTGGDSQKKTTDDQPPSAAGSAGVVVVPKGIPTETFLSGSFYGRFFLRRVGLAMYRKDIWKWKEWAKNLPVVPLAEPLGAGSLVDERLVEEDEEKGGEQMQTQTQTGPDDLGRRRKQEKRKKLSAGAQELEDILSGL